MNIQILPTINASLNALAGILLFLGWRAIKSDKPALHKKYMIAAFISSMVFLTSYLTYHYLKHGVVTHYQGEGVLRPIYYGILITHTILAMLIPFFAVLAVYFAVKNRFDKHTMVTKKLYPAWMYVSVTGVIIYLMLYIF